MKKVVKYWRDMEDGVDYVYTPAAREGAVVDIRMLTYNHEPYIRHAIESVLMQETKYQYRLIIGDDCSTDGTQRIIREYQEKYPDRIATILWNYNTGLTGHGCNGIILSRHCRAKYSATLEGDDYWTSPYKLEKAISFLEEHPQYVAYAHNIIIVDKNEKMLHSTGLLFYVQEEHIYTKKNALALQQITQTAALVNRNYMLAWNEDAWDQFHDCRCNGDVKRFFSLGISGDVFYSREIMSAYRRTFHGDSWTARTTGNKATLYFCDSRINLSKYVKNFYDIDLRLDDYLNGQLRLCYENCFRKLSLRNVWFFLKMFYRIRIHRTRNHFCN